MTPIALSFKAAEKTFRNLETIIRDAVTAYPKLISVPCEHARDCHPHHFWQAVNFILRNPRDIKTTVNMKKLLLICRNFEGIQVGDSFVIGPRSKPVPGSKVSCPSGQPHAAGCFLLNSPNNAVINAGCTLLRYGHANQLILSGKFDGEYVKTIPNGFDVGIVENDDGSVTIV